MCSLVSLLAHSISRVLRARHHMFFSSGEDILATYPYGTWPYRWKGTCWGKREHTHMTVEKGKTFRGQAGSYENGPDSHGKYSNHFWRRWTPWINCFPRGPTFSCSPIWTAPYQGPRLQHMFLRWAHSIAWSLSEKQLMKRLPLPSTQGQRERECLWFISEALARVSLPLFFTGMFSVWLLRSGLQGRRGICWPCMLSKAISQCLDVNLTYGGCELVPCVFSTKSAASCCACHSL